MRQINGWPSAMGWHRTQTTRFERSGRRSQLNDSFAVVLPRSTQGRGCVKTSIADFHWGALTIPCSKIVRCRSF